MTTIGLPRNSGFNFKKKINSVSEFIDYVLKWRYDNQSPVSFRGQKFSSWKTIPKIFRDNLKLYESENDIVRDIVTSHPEEFQNDRTMFDRLARMQHFGVPTRLLDVTTNPLIALWFSCEEHLDTAGTVQDGKVQAFFIPKLRQKYFDSDLVSCMANFANLNAKEKKEIQDNLDENADIFRKLPAVEKLVYNISIEKPKFENKINPVDLKKIVYVKPKMSNKRIHSQMGAFIIFAKKINSFSDAEFGIKSVIIPHERKKSIREELKIIGINRGLIFPEIEKSAENI